MVLKKYLQQINNRRCHIGMGIVCLCWVLMLVFGYAERYPYPTLLVGISLWLIFVNAPRHNRLLLNVKDGIVIRHEIINIPSSSLLASTFWSKNPSDFIVNTPTRFVANIEVLTRSGVRTVKAIRFEGQWDSPRQEKQTIKFNVDGGFLFLGDQVFAERIRRNGAWESEVFPIFEPDAEKPYALFSDPDGDAIVVLTGEGDDWYELEIETTDDGKYALSVDFFYYESKQAPTSLSG